MKISADNTIKSCKISLKNREIFPKTNDFNKKNNLKTKDKFF